MQSQTKPADEKDQPVAAEKEPPDRRRSTDSKLFVIAGRCGRLGNRLILFANFIALAEEQGHRVVNFTFHSYSTLFETTLRDIYCHYPMRERRSWLDAIPGVAATVRGTRLFSHAARAASTLNERRSVFGPTAVTLRESHRVPVTALDGPEVQSKIREAKLVFVDGWTFRAPTWVQRHAEKIRAYFKPIAEYEQASRQAVERLRREAEVVVGVHVRYGDNRKWRGGKYFWPTSRFVAWMHEMEGQFPRCKVAFLVCSDERRDVREFPGLSVGLGPGSPVGDLYALARCDYVFGPLSTYTQWASFYGETPMLHLHNTNDRVEPSNFRISYLGEIP